jgi:hypothetical protein
MDNPRCLRIAELIVLFVNIFYFGFVGFFIDKYEKEARKNWDLFYKRNADRVTLALKFLP